MRFVGRSLPLAITAEARRDLAERMAVVHSNPAMLAEISRGGFRAEEPDGFVEGTGGTLRVDGEIGIISVNGPLCKSTGGSMDDVLRFFGCTLYDDLWRSIEHCRENGLAGAIMRMNSPGGDAGGVGELSDFIFSLRGKFPIWSYIETQCASAAAWIATQTDRIVAHDTALVGWIGVIRGPLLDDSEFMEKHGFRLVEVVSKHAKAKRTVPLDDEVLARFQVMCDDLGDEFEGAVARGRNVPPEVVAKDFGEGDGMIAGKAKKARLIDELGSFNSTLQAFREHIASARSSGSSPATPAAIRTEGVVVFAAKTHNSGEATMAFKAESEPEKKEETKHKGEDEPEMTKCEECDGTGKDEDGKACGNCEGEGEIEKAAAGGEDGEGAKSKAEHEEPDGDEGKKALAALSGLRVSASVSAHTAAIEAKMVPRGKLTALEAKVNTMEAERKAEKQVEEDKRLNAIADRAAGLGYFAGLKGDELKGKRERFIKLARTEPDAIEEIIAALPGAKVSGRVTAHGNPAGGRQSNRAKIDAFEETGGGSRRVSHGDVDVLEKGSPDLMVRARSHAAQNKCSLEEAMVMVAKADPSLAR